MFRHDCHSFRNNILVEARKKRKGQHQSYQFLFPRSFSENVLHLIGQKVGHVTTSGCKEAGKAVSGFQAFGEENNREKSAGNSCWTSQSQCLPQIYGGQSLFKDKKQMCKSLEL